MLKSSSQLRQLASDLSLRFFQQTAKLTPHTPEYLKLQLNFLRSLGKQADIISLKKNHPVIISNINSHFLLKDIIAYDAAHFGQLTLEEYQDIKKRCDSEGAGLKFAHLHQDLDCVKYNSEMGHPIYYINRFKLKGDLNSLKSFEEFINQDFNNPAAKTL